MGCPIRTSTDQRLLAAPRGFSQRATSFIASRCQGIHQMPLPQRLIAKTRRLQRQALHNNKLSREDTHSKKPEVRNQKPDGLSPPRIRTSSIVTEAFVRPPTPRWPSNAASAHSLFTLSKITRARAETPAQTQLPDRSSSPRAGRSRGCSATAAALCDERCLAAFAQCSRGASAPLSHLETSFARSVVEVIGIEPTTSCLQSRRSPN